MTRVARFAAARPLGTMLGRDDERGFVFRFALLMSAVLVVPWAASLLHLHGPLSYLVPASAAAILALTYLRRPAEALLGMAVLVLFYDTIALRLGNPIKAVDEITVGLLVLAALPRALRTWRSWIWLPRDATLVAAIGIAVISSLAAGVPIGIWVPALFVVSKAIAFLYVATWTEFREWELRAGMGVVFAIGLAVLGIALIELLTPTLVHRIFGLPQYARSRGQLPVVKSLFVIPALFGWFSAFVALFLYAQFSVTRRWFWLAFAVALSLGPFLSARRRAILALAAGLGAAFVESVRRLRTPRALFRAWWPVAASLVLLVALFMSAIIGLYELTIDRYLSGLDRQIPVVTPGSKPPSAGEGDENPQARLALYIGSVKVARDYFPLGAGLGRYASWMSRVHYSPLYRKYGLSTIRGLRPNNPRDVTDTFWPQILGEFGIAGLVAYLAFLGSLGYRLFREAGRDDGPLLRVFRLGAGMVFAQAIVESIASSMYHSPPRVYLLYLTVGAVLSVAWRRNERQPAAAESLSTEPR
jgi:hypothetical protein